MNQCAKCGATTEVGQFYRFYFGVFVEESVSFQARGSEEVYYCDRCLLQAAAREEMIRSGFFLVLGLFAILAVLFHVAALTRGLWLGLVVLFLIAALGGAANQRFRHLRAALRAKNPDQVRHAVSSNSKIQNLGDEWAIAHRRLALQKEGGELFLTRRENEFWSQP